MLHSLSCALTPIPPICCLLPQLLASQVLNPRSIDVSLDDIGGLEQVKEDMVRTAAGTAVYTTTCMPVVPWLDQAAAQPLLSKATAATLMVSYLHTLYAAQLLHPVRFLVWH